MIMQRGLRAFAFVSACLFSGVKAYELTSMKVESALHEPLLAEIGLSVENINPDTPVIVDLASKLEFMQHRVKRYYYIPDLETSFVKNATGQPVIRVKSNEPMMIPTVEFLIMLLSDKGKEFGKYKFILPQYREISDPPVMVANTVSKAYKPQQLLALQPKVKKKKSKKPTFGRPSTRLFSNINSDGKKDSTGQQVIVSKANFNNQSSGLNLPGAFHKSTGFSKETPVHVVVKKVKPMVTHDSPVNVSYVKSVHNVDSHRFPSRRLLAHLDGPRRISSGSVKLAKNTVVTGEVNKVVDTQGILHAAVTARKANKAESYTVKKGDSISAIAMKLVSSYPSHSTWQSLMSDLVERNPEAFKYNNINNLKPAYSLQLPPIQLQVVENSSRKAEAGMQVALEKSSEVKEKGELLQLEKNHLSPLDKPVKVTLARHDSINPQHEPQVVETSSEKFTPSKSYSGEEAREVPQLAGMSWTFFQLPTINTLVQLEEKQLDPITPFRTPAGSINDVAGLWVKDGLTRSTLVAANQENNRHLSSETFDWERLRMPDLEQGHTNQADTPVKLASVNFDSISPVSDQQVLGMPVEPLTSQKRGSNEEASELTHLASLNWKFLRLPENSISDQGESVGLEQITPFRASSVLSENGQESLVYKEAGTSLTSVAGIQGESALSSIISGWEKIRVPPLKKGVFNQLEKPVEVAFAEPDQEHKMEKKPAEKTEESKVVGSYDSRSMDKINMHDRNADGFKPQGFFSVLVL